MIIWNPSELRQVFTDAELERVSSARRLERHHPFGTLLAASESTPALAATMQAFRLVLRQNKPWLEAAKKRFLDIEEYSASSSVLAELRAYGALLSVFRSVRPVPVAKGRKSADFCVTLSSSQEVYVEVQAKQWDQSEADRLQKFFEGSRAPRPSGAKVGSGIHVSQPFGRPKARSETNRAETVTENMISRIAQIKDGDLQVPSGKASILWLDLQDRIWEGFPFSSHLRPVMSWNGCLTSGGIWHAFYGRVGMTLLENSETAFGCLGTPMKMRHDGRFYQQDDGKFRHRAGAVIISLPEETALYENPQAATSLPSEFFLSALGLPWFSIEDCWLNWPDQGLKARLELTEKMLRELPLAIRAEMERRFSD